MRRALVILLALWPIALAGCSLRKAPSVEDYYAQGELMFAQGNYNNAIENYEHLIDQFPFSPYAEDAELKIGLAYYREKEYGEAVSALNDFERMHPTNKDLHLASYFLAMSYFDQIGREDQDQSATRSALHQFEELEQRFPESPFAELAHERIAICREMLARNQLVVSNFYFKRANYRAAESRLAELMQKYPDTPVASEALYELGVTLKKEGKKYSAAQAFAAVTRHYPDTPYAAKAQSELTALNQPIDNEEDPLRLVLAESGFGPAETEDHGHVLVRQRDAESPTETTAANSEYGPDGLPILNPGPIREAKAAGGPVTLRTIRLGASDPPLSMILDLSGPVKFEREIENGQGYSTLTVKLKNASPDSKLERHLVFDRSIFKDCEVLSDSGETTIRVNTLPVARFAIIPLEEPPRLLVTFTPRDRQLDESAISGL
jgi:outer membrane protein assembly factor BamD